MVGQSLRTHEQFTLSAQGGRAVWRLEDYIVHALTDFDDIDYTVHAGLLYDLAGQMVVHLRSYLTEEDEVRNVPGWLAPGSASHHAHAPGGPSAINCPSSAPSRKSSRCPK